MGLHRCIEADCCYTGQPSPSACGCHKSDATMLREQNAQLVTALRRLAGNVGALAAFKHEIIDAAGCTNWQCVMDAVAEADALLASGTSASTAATELFEAARQMSGDYQTSELHHPDHVLVPLAAFKAMQAAVVKAEEA